VTKLPAVQSVIRVQTCELACEEKWDASHWLQVLSLMLVALLAMYVPAVQLGLVQTAQKLALARAENSPAAQGAQVRSLVAVPFAVTKLPPLQLRHEEHARSEVEDPAALAKVPPPQTVQGVHLAVGGRLDSDTVKIPLRMVSLGHEEGVPWQSVPCNALVLAEHDPLNGVTVHGLEAQVVGLT
jgi:hypothetical protein